jgi:hypothetical protein
MTAFEPINSSFALLIRQLLPEIILTGMLIEKIICVSFRIFWNLQNNYSTFIFAMYEISVNTTS